MMGHARLLLLAMVRLLAIAAVRQVGVDPHQRMYSLFHTTSLFSPLVS
jgi:hypothetical protein